MTQKSNFLAEKIIRYNEQLDCDIKLPKGFALLNPIKSNPNALWAMKTFYRKFYNDKQPRKFILGINPGRFGAGITGIPFTDTKHLKSHCGISLQGKSSYEPSAKFVYKMIEAYGGAPSFYRDIYIQSIFPLTIVRENSKGHFVNCNYYDDKQLFDLLKPYMIKHLKSQLNWGLQRDTVFVFGKKNAKFIQIIDAENSLFAHIEVLEHPRYIQQYKSKETGAYANNFVRKLKEL